MLALVGSSGGSSPRARGARDQAVVALAVAGIIPACAGSTFGGWIMRGWPRDHPRVRGEHTLGITQKVTAMGSSPRARGALEDHARLALFGGIIPACAGSTGRGCSPGRPAGDHPRVRGEHRRRDTGKVTEAGSSPRARGAPPGLRAQALHHGIIPACAGSTPGSAWPRPRPRDHPRVRGEHTTGQAAGTATWGSSPRARGAQKGEGEGGRCGGSSPRARGAHRGAVGGPRGAGIIPACAGSTGR